MGATAVELMYQVAVNSHSRREAVQPCMHLRERRARCVICLRQPGATWCRRELARLKNWLVLELFFNGFIAIIT